MAVLAFNFIHCPRVTSDEILVGVLSVAACLLFFNVFATNRPNR